MSGTLGVLDVLLGVAVLGAALAAVLVPRRAGAVGVFLVFGVLLAVLWARFDAPDIALAEAVLGGGVAGALLVDALASPAPDSGTRGTRGTRGSSGSGGSRDGVLARRATVAAAALGGAVLFAALVAVVTSLPGTPRELPALVAAEMPRTGVDHGVTAVLLNYRTLDTLLEIAVLALAALAASAVADAPRRAAVRPEPVVRALAVVLVPAGLLVASWFLLAGTTRPGGAFQAGAVLGATLVVAYLAELPGTTSHGRVGDVGVVGGLLAFVLLAAATAVLGGGWLVLDPSWASSVILALETVLALGIGAGLLRLFVAARSGARSTA